MEEDSDDETHEEEEDEYVFKLCEACPKLIDRFEEREENVNVNQNECQWIISLHGINYFAEDGFFNTFIELLQQTENVIKGQIEINEQSPKWLLKQEVPKIVRSINRQLHEKPIMTKVGFFKYLLDLVSPDFLADHMGSLSPGIEKVLSDKSFTSNLKIEALIFARLVLASHSPPVFSILISRLFLVLLYLLWESEVNECTISCMDLVVSTFGDNLNVELPVCLPVLVDRMGNEITRLTAVKANQPLRQATLWTLNSLIVAYGDKIGSSAYEVIIV
ncbi:unnamed protein product [Prunus armeniaca]|uniref:Uncharacterized protein n=1 Tax=Prunus armeniaca TaxID=36596 RepID=A0A6J5V5Y8_PRUAR|nr:unnamed protein product [Prunus armeniaca]